MSDKTNRRRALVDPAGPASEPFRTLRLALDLRSDTDSRTVLVTSAEPRVGKTTIAVNYALVSSLSHISVLLVDGDLRAPTVHEAFGLERSPGLVELIAAGGDLPD